MENNTAKIRADILKGLEISFRKLILQKSKEDGVLIFIKDGKIIKVKAKELLK